MSIKNETDIENGFIQLSSQKNELHLDNALIEKNIDIFYELFRLMACQICEHLYVHDGMQFSVRYWVIRRCDGENRLKARSGMVPWPASGGLKQIPICLNRLVVGQPA